MHGSNLFPSDLLCFFWFTVSCVWGVSTPLEWVIDYCVDPPSVAGALSISLGTLESSLESPLLSSKRPWAAQQTRFPRFCLKTALICIFLILFLPLLQKFNKESHKLKQEWGSNSCFQSGSRSKEVLPSVPVMTRTTGHSICIRPNCPSKPQRLHPTGSSSSLPGKRSRSQVLSQCLQCPFSPNSPGILLTKSNTHHSPGQGPTTSNGIT